MKKILISCLLAAMSFCAYSQELKPIKLNRPDTKREMSLMQTLEKRHSVREYADKKLTTQDLSDLLWAANGVNRPESGKRTAPSAMNMQEVSVYVCMPEGTYVYDAKNNMLNPVAKGDLRPAVAGQQEFAAKAPVCLVLVSDISRFKSGNKEQNLIMGAVDAGIVSQNISLFCTAAGLATVPRASMDQNKLRTALKLNDSQHLLMNHPVGYPK